MCGVGGGGGVAVDIYADFYDVVVLLWDYGSIVLS